MFCSFINQLNHHEILVLFTQLNMHCWRNAKGFLTCTRCTENTSDTNINDFRVMTAMHLRCSGKKSNMNLISCEGNSKYLKHILLFFFCIHVVYRNCTNTYIKSFMLFVFSDVSKEGSQYCVSNASWPKSSSNELVKLFNPEIVWILKLSLYVINAVILEPK